MSQIIDYVKYKKAERIFEEISKNTNVEGIVLPGNVTGGDNGLVMTTSLSSMLLGYQDEENYVEKRMISGDTLYIFDSGLNPDEYGEHALNYLLGNSALTEIEKLDITTMTVNYHKIRKVIVGPRVKIFGGWIPAAHHDDMKITILGSLSCVTKYACYQTEALRDIPAEILKHCTKDTRIEYRAFSESSMAGVKKITAKQIGTSAFASAKWIDSDKVKIDVEAIGSNAFGKESGTVTDYPSKFWISKRCRKIDINERTTSLILGDDVNGIFRGNYGSIDVYLEHDSIPETWSDHWADYSPKGYSASTMTVNIHLGVSEEEFNAL